MTNLSASLVFTLWKIDNIKYTIITILKYTVQLLFSCLVLSDYLQRMDCNMAGFLVLHHLLELAQTHVHWSGDAIQAYSHYCATSVRSHSFCTNKTLTAHNSSSSPLPSFWQPPCYFLFLWIGLLSVSHVSGIILCLSFGTNISLSRVSTRSIHAMACDRIAFLFCAWVLSCVWYPMDCSLPGCSVHRISQAKILEWVAISFSRESSPPRDRIRVSCISRQILYHWATWETHLPF